MTAHRSSFTHIRASCLCALLVTGMTAHAQGIKEFPATHSSSVGVVTGSHGLCGSCLLHHSQVPLLCFGLDKRPNQQPRFTYLILLKTDAKHGGREATIIGRGPGRAGADAIKGDTTIDIDDKTFTVQYDIEIDPATQKPKKESIVLNGQELKTDGPRVFLLDLSVQKPTLKPLPKVKLPNPGPDFTEDDTRKWIPPLQKAVEKLKLDSEEVVDFLTQK